MNCIRCVAARKVDLYLGIFGGDAPYGYEFLNTSDLNVAMTNDQ
ncbi:hypothetical protein QUA56_01075 [Microcoleus sp. N3A4]